MKTSPSLGRETQVLFIGRVANLLLSLLCLLVYPSFFGPEAHGTLQYYLGLYLLILGYLNGCAAPLLAHYTAIYQVSDRPRVRVLIRQCLNWFALVLLSVWILYPFLKSNNGFIWIFTGAGLAGLAQLLASLEYGLGWLGPTTWFPVIIMFFRLVLVGGFAILMTPSAGSETLNHLTEMWIPALLCLTAVPALGWLMIRFSRVFQSFPKPAQPAGHPMFPLAEIRQFGIATMLGQIIYQAFTRSLVPLAEQVGYPRSEVGYLGLALQAFGLVVYLAGIFSISSYPWLVSAGESDDKKRFKEIQGEAWRYTALFGGGLVALILGLTAPTIWVILGEAYRPDLEKLYWIFVLSTLAGGAMLIAEFHLRMLISLTQTTRYLIVLIAGFSLTLPYFGWVLINHLNIVFFTGSLPLGITGIALLSLLLAPKTNHFWGITIKSVGCAGIVLMCSCYLVRGLEIATLITRGVSIPVLYGSLAWMTGLLKNSDLKRFSR